MVGSSDRYARQLVLPELGPAGQEKLKAASVLIVGAGALGSVQSQLMVRLGVGRILIVDADVPEAVNLHRQLLYDESDVASGIPKAVTASRKLGIVNSDVLVEGRAVFADASNIEALVEGRDLVFDATDNIEGRYLLNDACVKHEIPWIYGGVIGATGVLMPVLPGEGPCLRCLFPDPPPAGSLPTSETHGILNTAPAVVASLQVTEGVKILVGRKPEGHRLVSLDLWSGEFRSIEVSRDPMCPCCSAGSFPFLKQRPSAEDLS